MSGLVLKKKINIDRLKLFNDVEKDPSGKPPIPSERPTRSPEQKTSRNNDHSYHKVDTSNTPSNPEVMNNIETYIREISSNGNLQRLIEFVTNLHLTKPQHVFNLQELLIKCPIQSFISEVSEELEDELDEFATKILPHVKNLNLSLDKMTTVTMILSSVCVKAASLFEPPLSIAETLKNKPDHLMNVPNISPEIPVQQLVIGGETLASNDLATLEEGEWLNDKVINSYLGLLKVESNGTNLQVFILPSYTAVMWENGNMDSWMFKKVQFNLYKYIMMPINIAGNHWVLMVVDVTERTVAVLDSMNGRSGARWLHFWRDFIGRRNRLPDVLEELGPWTSNPLLSSKQTDGSSCGIFTLMNAECVMKSVHINIMRQVHCSMFRKYVKNRLLFHGTSKEKQQHCDMPGRTVRISKGQKYVQCCVCGRWIHVKCSNITDIRQDFVCCVCQAMYS